MLLNCGVGEDSWESLGLQGDPTNPSWRKSGLNIHWKDWCWSWNSNTLATWCEELTHLKRPWCWEILKAGEKGENTGWDGWMASPTQWTWVWVGSGSWWWTGRPGMLQSMGLQRVGHDWATELTDPDTLTEARPRFDPWVGNIPWRREWQSTPVLLPREFNGQRSLAGYSSWGRKESDMIERLTLLLSS